MLVVACMWAEVGRSRPISASLGPDSAKFGATTTNFGPSSNTELALPWFLAGMVWPLLAAPAAVPALPALWSRAPSRPPHRRADARRARDTGARAADTGWRRIAHLRALSVRGRRCGAGSTSGRLGWGRRKSCSTRCPPVKRGPAHAAWLDMRMPSWRSSQSQELWAEVVRAAVYWRIPLFWQRAARMELSAV